MQAIASINGDRHRIETQRLVGRIEEVDLFVQASPAGKTSSLPLALRRRSQWYGRIDCRPQKYIEVMNNYTLELSNALSEVRIVSLDPHSLAACRSLAPRPPSLRARHSMRSTMP